MQFFQKGREHILLIATDAARTDVDQGLVRRSDRSESSRPDQTRSPAFPDLLGSLLHPSL